MSSTEFFRLATKISAVMTSRHLLKVYQKTLLQVCSLFNLCNFFISAVLKVYFFIFKLLTQFISGQRSMLALTLACGLTRHLSAGGRLLPLMCAVKTEDDCFRYTNVMCAQYQCWYRSIFIDTDTESIPVVSADTEYPMPVLVSP